MKKTKIRIGPLSFAFKRGRGAGEQAEGPRSGSRRWRIPFPAVAIMAFDAVSIQDRLNVLVEAEAAAHVME